MTEVADRTSVGSREWSSTQWLVVAVSVVIGVGARWLFLGRSSTTFDESFTAMAARRPIGDIPMFLRSGDSHPPLDYLMRHVFADTGSTMWLRFPSALLGTATLLVVVWWMRNRGWFGVLVVAFTSVAAIQVLYARQARMYALVIFAGALAAAAAERWLDERRLRWSLLAATALTVALFSHTATLLFAFGALLLPGLRRDRAAWVWRACVLGPVALWAVLWGPSTVDQLDHDPASWIPFTSPRTALESVAGQVSLYDSLSLLVVVAVVAGGVLLVQRERSLGRVWLCLFVAPAVAIMLLGIGHHLLLPRSLAFAAWGPVLAVAVLGAACVENRPRWLTGPIGIVGLIVCVLLVVPSLGSAFDYEEDSAPTRKRLADVVVPGDSVAISPPFLAPMLQWDHDLPPDTAPSDLLVDDNAWSAMLPGAPSTGRLWVVVPDTYAFTPPPTFGPCADVDGWHAGDLSLSCYVAGAGTSGSG